MLNRLWYILSIYFSNGYFWIFILFVTIILLSLFMIGSLQANELCSFAKQIETRNGDKIKSTITQHCWTDKKPIKKIIPLPDELPKYGETFIIRHECIGDEIIKHNINGMEYNCD